MLISVTAKRLRYWNCPVMSQFAFILIWGTGMFIITTTVVPVLLLYLCFVGIIFFKSLRNFLHFLTFLLLIPPPSPLPPMSLCLSQPLQVNQRPSPNSICYSWSPLRENSFPITLWVSPLPIILGIHSCPSPLETLLPITLRESSYHDSEITHLPISLKKTYLAISLKGTLCLSLLEALVTHHPWMSSLSILRFSFGHYS